MPSLPGTRQKDSSPDFETWVDPKSLERAFEVFNSAAGSLESSYSLLHQEVARLRRELALRNQDLAQSLAENERMRARLSLILEHLPCGVLVLGPAEELRYANDAARRLLASLAAASNPLSTDTLQSLFEAVGNLNSSAEREWSVGRGSDSIVLGVSRAEMPTDGRPGKEQVIILRDVSGQKRLDEEREVSSRMRALAEMTAVLAHEIRNPLGSMELFASLVKDATRDEPEVSQWMVHLQAGLRALAATVNNVLHFYSQAPLETGRIDLVRLLTETVAFLQPLALERSMIIEWSPAVSPIMVRADSHRLQQVFFNLTINAFRAMSAGATLQVRLEVDAQPGKPWVRVAFRDHGVGISEANLVRIFNPGFSTRRSSPGLGLAVSERVVRQHGGSIKVTSVVGQGSTFTLSLPVAEE